MNPLLSTDGLTAEIADIVAEATMQLPSLAHQYDAEFLRHETNRAITIFLDAYRKGESPEYRSRFSDAQNANDPVTAGVVLHESLAGEGSAARAKAAFDVARSEINASIVDDYSAFTRDIASKN